MLKVAIFIENALNIYSGGRYHGLILAECLAYKNHDVYFITNNKPLFYEDFNHLASHHKIHLQLTPLFIDSLSPGNFDLVIIVPGRNNPPFYFAAKKFALEHKAKIVLINFESANWFNEYSPVFRSEKIWEDWKKVCQLNALVLSSAKESQKYAKEYYIDFPDRTFFDVWSPPINTPAADSIKEMPKENRIILMSRLCDPHKGMQEIISILPDRLNGWTLTLVTGIPTIENETFLKKVKPIIEERGGKLEFFLCPNDKEKFSLLKQAKIILFPSYFEGYGYPPLEALYCNTECLAYELPVLKETCKEGIHFAERGNQEAFKERLTQLLKDPLLGNRQLKSLVTDLVTFEKAADRIETVLKNYLEKPSKKPSKKEIKAFLSSNKKKSLVSRFAKKLLAIVKRHKENFPIRIMIKIIKKLQRRF